MNTSLTHPLDGGCAEPRHKPNKLYQTPSLGWWCEQWWWCESGGGASGDVEEIEEDIWYIFGEEKEEEAIWDIWRTQI